MRIRENSRKVCMSVKSVKWSMVGQDFKVDIKVNNKSYYRQRTGSNLQVYTEVCGKLPTILPDSIFIF